MPIEEWELLWDAGLAEDGSWSVFRVDDDDRFIEHIVRAWIDVSDDAIKVDLKIVAMPPMPPPRTLPDGSVKSSPRFRMHGARGLVTDLIIRDLMLPELRGKTFATMAFYERDTGELVAEYKDRKF